LGIKEHILKKHINKLMAQAHQKATIVKPIKQIAILNNTTSKLDFKSLKYLQKSLGISSDRFSIFTIKQKNDNYNELRGIVATKEDISIFGKIKSPEITEFLSKKYDLLIDLTQANNSIEKYFSLSIPSGFRVGYNTDEKIYDLMLSIEKGDIHTFTDEMCKYFTILGLIR